MAVQSLRSFLFVASLALFALMTVENSAFAQNVPVPQTVPAQTHTPGAEGQTPSPVILGQPIEMPPRRQPFLGYSILSANVDVIDFNRFWLEFEDPEIAMLDGLRLSTRGLNQELTGGVSFGLGGRIHGYLILPQFTLSVGGGSLDVPWNVQQGTEGALEVRPSSLTYLRAELSMGVTIPQLRFRPYATVRAAGAAYFVDVEVRSPQLGALGSEYVTQGFFEFGTEVGLAFQVNQAMEIAVGWRATWVGVPSQGVVLTLSIGSFQN